MHAACDKVWRLSWLIHLGHVTGGYLLEIVDAAKYSVTQDNIKELLVPKI